MVDFTITEDLPKEQIASAFPIFQLSKRSPQRVCAAFESGAISINSKGRSISKF
jgi:hypothetical protein